MNMLKTVFVKDNQLVDLLTCICFLQNFYIYQMNVKSAFLNGYMMEEVYVKQPHGFENFNFPHHVYKL